MKPICLVTAPVATRSGYGAHSRDICRALIKLDKYDKKWIIRSRIMYEIGPGCI